MVLDESKVVKFYENRTVLVTGFTGFIGKVLVRKLLEDTKVSTVYVLLRPKKGLTASERLQKILDQPPMKFDDEKCPNLDKLKVIEGDISVTGLDLSTKYMEEVTSKVSIVFHVAANVRFENDMSCIADNVFGVKHVLDLCHKMKALDSLIYVSTAYSNCNVQDIEEKVYPLGASASSVLSLLQSVKNQGQLHEIVSKLLAGRPNFYTFSKALAENLILEEKGNLKVAILRPSIIIQAVKEPKPGWVDSVNGLPGIALASYIGLLRETNWDYWKRVDVIPIDICCNVILASAWHIGEQRDVALKVYNVTSARLNPVTWGEMFELARSACVDTPSERMIRPPMYPPRYTSAPIYFPLARFFNHLVFAFIFDLIMRMLGHKPTLLRITQKLNSAMDNFEFFTLLEWNFKTPNYESLINAMSEVDKKVFNVDIRQLNWQEYMPNFILGLRRYLLREKDESLTRSRKRQRIIATGYQLFLAFIWLFLASLAFILYRVGHMVLVWQPFEGNKMEA